MSTTHWIEQLRRNVARVRSDIAGACQRARRDPADVRLVGVTKYVSPTVLRELLGCGVDDIGESRPQQIAARAAECGPANLDWPATGDVAGPHPRWHMIGHLQRNKIKMLLPHARIIHSIDSQRLAAAVASQAADLHATVDVFIEVNVSGESSKGGVSPSEAHQLADFIAAQRGIRLRGLMTMAPFDADPETARPYFARLRVVLQELREGLAGATHLRHLSMGMSQDYVQAVEEGATFVRVGSALFEGLPSEPPA